MAQRLLRSDSFRICVPPILSALVMAGVVTMLFP
jgi:hypothetical protein